MRKAEVWLIISSLKDSNWRRRTFQCSAANPTSFVVASSVWSCHNSNIQVGWLSSPRWNCLLVVFSWAEDGIVVAEVADGEVVVEGFGLWWKSVDLLAGMFRVALV